MSAENGSSKVLVHTAVPGSLSIRERFARIQVQTPA